MPAVLQRALETEREATDLPVDQDALRSFLRGL